MKIWQKNFVDQLSKLFHGKVEALDLAISLQIIMRTLIFDDLQKFCPLKISRVAKGK